ncbi:hypothetical protein CSUI_002004, partial [Cystoisospora suis]
MDAFPLTVQPARPEAMRVGSCLEGIQPGRRRTIGVPEAPRQERWGARLEFQDETGALSTAASTRFHSTLESPTPTGTRGNRTQFRMPPLPGYSR